VRKKKRTILLRILRFLILALCGANRTVRAALPTVEPLPVAGNPVWFSAVPTGDEHVAPATDFLLFGAFSAFPEGLGLFANFFFAHIVCIFMSFFVFVFCPLGKFEFSCIHMTNQGEDLHVFYLRVCSARYRLISVVFGLPANPLSKKRRI
jgi:hypothetical protein